METETKKIVKMRLRKTWDESGNVMSIAFDGVDIDGDFVAPMAEPIRFDRTKATAEMRDQAERHGWEQKHGDCAAIPKDTKSGKSATVTEKRDAVLESCERFEQGATSWTAKGGPRILTPEQKRALLDKLAAELGVTIS